MTKRLSFALDVLKRATKDGKTKSGNSAMPGFTVCAFHQGRPILHEAFGTIDGKQPVRHETLYDLASITKPIATASSVITLLERGELLLGQSIAEYLPQASHLSKVTLAHLLTHTSGLPAWTACYKEGYGPENAVERILQQPTTAAPGLHYEYSCLGFILLSRVVKQITGQELDAFAPKNVFAPLGLKSLTYHPKPTQCAPTMSNEGPDATLASLVTLQGVVHDGNARGISCENSGVSGNAGLFGNAYDVARFGESLRNPGKLFGTPTLRRVFENQLRPEVGGHTLLFFANPNGLNPTGDILSSRAVGHSGFTGTVLTIDPTFDLTVCVLTNAVYGDGKDEWLRTRRKFMNALAAAVE
jgi:serine-type D-Ala-D-Ala carboxypeptidase